MPFSSRGNTQTRCRVLLPSPSFVIPLYQVRSWHDWLVLSMSSIRRPALCKRPISASAKFTKASARYRLLHHHHQYCHVADGVQLLIWWASPGLTATQTWNTANTLESKIELADYLAKGLKIEPIFNFQPATQAYGSRVNLHFQQANFHGRTFIDLLKGPVVNVDAVIGHEGLIAGAAAGYNVQKAQVTNYSAAIGYIHNDFTASVTATDNLSVFAASYYHKVNKQVEASAKATWASKSGNAVGLELATKYRVDPMSFWKVSAHLFGMAGAILPRQDNTD